MAEPFGFDHYGRRRRRTTGRRLLADRRVIPSRRLTERRIELVPITIDRREGIDRRCRWERRRETDRRLLENRRVSAWKGLEGN